MLNRVFAIIISVLTVQTVVANVLMQTAFDSAALGGGPPNQPDADFFLGNHLPPDDSNDWKSVTNQVPTLGKDQQFIRLRIEEE